MIVHCGRYCNNHVCTVRIAVVTRPYECLCRYTSLTVTLATRWWFAVDLRVRPRITAPGVFCWYHDASAKEPLAHLCASVLPPRDQKSDVPVAVLLPRKRHDYYT